MRARSSRPALVAGADAVPFRLAGRRVWVAGHRGMVGAAVVRRLRGEGGRSGEDRPGEDCPGEDCEVLTADRAVVDLTRQREVEDWLADQRPEVVVVAAARVGGIVANDTQPADFIYENLAIETNVIEAAHRAGVAKLVFLGSSCVYPRAAPQPMSEDALLTGPLEPTNQWYAIAKIAGIKLCQAYRRQHGSDFIAAQPTNLYGPGDNFNLRSSHVIPALIRKVHEAKTAGATSVEIWGTGKPRREFLYVDDLADALVFLLKHYSGEAHINVGTGRDMTIAELAETVSGVVGYAGALRFDTTKPDGTPRKLLDVARLTALGWRARTDLETGLRRTYAWYLDDGAPRR